MFIVHIHGKKVGKNLEGESEGEFKLYLVIRESQEEILKEFLSYIQNQSRQIDLSQNVCCMKT
jgi:hypothetical protein